MRVRRNEEARIALSKAVRLNPKSASAHNNYGVALSLNGRMEEAIHHFQEAVRILPIFVEAKKNLAKAFVYQKTEKDIQLLKEAIRRNPEQAELYHSLGDLTESRGEMEQAIQWYEKSLSLQSNQVEILKKLSIIKAVRGEYDAAILFQKQLLEVQPENAEACYFIASVYARKNQVQLSIQWLKKAMDNGFHNPELLKTDENLNNIRKTKGFRKLVDR
jgi:Tfp pilus assembly protein PilF